jgi:mannose-6-phosphate isomerase-like protein (cupin superfamily)
MSHHATKNIDDAEDMAPGYGMGDMGQARFLRKDLGMEGVGMANYKMNAGQRIGFGHAHAESEEIYVVLSGNGRFKVEDEIVDVGERDVVYCGKDTMRGWEAGPDGMELLAFGHHVEGDATMEQGWWTD